jgi:hypothetical protein
LLCDDVAVVVESRDGSVTDDGKGLFRLGDDLLPLLPDELSIDAKNASAASVIAFVDDSVVGALS